jgi:hypothetical protein
MHTAAFRYSSLAAMALSCLLAGVESTLQAFLKNAFCFLFA